MRYYCIVLLSATPVASSVAETKDLIAEVIQSVGVSEPAKPGYCISDLIFPFLITR